MLAASTRAFVVHFFKRYPKRTALLTGLLFLSSLAEGVGVVALLPLLELTVNAGTPRSSVSAGIERLLLGAGIRPTLAILLVIIVVAIGLKGALRLLAMKQVGVTVSRVATDLRLSLIDALLRTRWSYFTRTPTGRFANALASETNRTSTGYKSAVNMLAAVIQVLVYTVAALLISWRLAVVAVLAGGAIVLTLSRLVQMSRAATQAQSRLMRSLLGRFTDALQGIKPIKAMGKEDYLRPLLERETKEINRTQERQVVATEAVAAAQEPLLMVAMATFLYVALTFGEQTLGGVLVLSFLFYRLAGRIGVVQINYQQITTSESFYGSLQQTIDAARREREPKSGRRAPVLRESIDFRKVTFAYGERVVLTDASLHIPAGKFVALLGPSGAGKTTIADLLVRLYVPTSGHIDVDGVPLADIGLAAWRRAIGYVPQEMFLFHDSVFSNVTLGDPAIGEDDVKRALAAAGAWDFVAALPEGIHTVLGERGSRVSGGQRQRIAIARALASGPSLLILDEVTTALDRETEAAICSTLSALTPGVTILAISHQEAMMQVADMVYRVEGGKTRRLEVARLSK